MNTYRLSGFLWSFDPCNYAETRDVHTDAYDEIASAIIALGADEDGILAILDANRVVKNQEVLERIQGFLALS